MCTTLHGRWRWECATSRRSTRSTSSASQVNYLILIPHLKLASALPRRCLGAACGEVGFSPAGSLQPADMSAARSVYADAGAVEHLVEGLSFDERSAHHCSLALYELCVGDAKHERELWPPPPSAQRPLTVQLRVQRTLTPLVAAQQGLAWSRLHLPADRPRRTPVRFVCMCVCVCVCCVVPTLFVSRGRRICRSGRLSCCQLILLRVWGGG